MKKMFGRRYVIVSLAVVLALLLGGVALARNPSFQINHGLIRALNALFEPNGYDGQQWTGTGSGISFAVSPQEGRKIVCLDLRTPQGTISLPFTYEKDPVVRFSGTGFTCGEPITFLSADGVAEISIHSQPQTNASVRFAGTGLTIHTAAGPVAIDVTPDSISVEGAGLSESWHLSDGSWSQ